MGLSDGERFNKVFYNLMKMAQIKRFEPFPYHHFNPLLDQLWPALLGGKGNSAYWLLGGALADDYFDEMNIAKAAFHNVLPYFQSNENDDEEQDNAEDDKNKNRYFKYKSEFSPTALSLLRQVDAEHENIMKLFMYGESFMYAANRYPDDKVAKQLTSVREVVARIMGECLTIFSQDSRFFAAYMGEHIFNNVLTYTAEDMVNQWFMSQHLHHHVRLHHVENQELLSIFNEVRKDKRQISSNRRLDIALKFLGPEYHYAHNHQELYKMIQIHNETHPDDLIDLESTQIYCTFVRCAKKLEDKTKIYFRYCDLTNTSLNDDS